MLAGSTPVMLNKEKENNCSGVIGTPAPKTNVIMLRIVARHPKAIAWFLVTIFYTQMVAAASLMHKETPLLLITKKVPGSFSSMKWPVVNTEITAPATAPVKNGRQAVNAGAHMLSAAASPAIGGPGQPEMQAFSSVNANNMVDLFSGDFSYNIPLMDVGGYPIGIAYRGGVTMDQEASWVGLGWNVNPGTITRNLRGLPDDFDGRYDSVKKITSIRENKTIGGTIGFDMEIVGVPTNKTGGSNTSSDTASAPKLTIGGSLGMFHNSYRGWGLEFASNASLNAGGKAAGSLTAGLSMSNNSQEGFTVTPTLSGRLSSYNESEKSGIGGSFTISAPYSSRYGLKALQLSTGFNQFRQDKKNQDGNKFYSNGGTFSSVISFFSPTYTPTISIPYTSNQFSFTAKVGFEGKVIRPAIYGSGYVSRQFIAPADTMLALPSYGYLHYQEGARNPSSLLDFNREKEIPYRENPPVAHIGIPNYTYDAFSITGEGVGGMFRAYRGDIGAIYDHSMRTRDKSNRLSVDIGTGDLFHAGVDLNLNRAFSENNPWIEKNTMQDVVRFRSNNAAYEAVYFRNPGEKSINSKAFYNALGGDEVVTVGLSQTGSNSPDIMATNFLNIYNQNKQSLTQRALAKEQAVKPERDKRTQVISYLTAKEADVAGLSRYIDTYTPNVFQSAQCAAVNEADLDGYGKGMPAVYFNNRTLSGKPDAANIDLTMWHNWDKDVHPATGIGVDDFSIRWEGRIKAPETGEYTFSIQKSDDGIRLWLEDTLLINRWLSVDQEKPKTAKVRLIKGEFYKFRMEFYEVGGYAYEELGWIRPGKTQEEQIPAVYMYAPAKDTFAFGNYLVKEKRVNGFRKNNHISEIDVLNNDGRRYVYGIPVYNLQQKEATFAVNGDRANRLSGLVGYDHGVDNTTKNRNGKDWYYNSEEVPSYAHSFLLTGILSADYVDITGNGISDDDLGDAVKFNYSKIRGIGNPYRWRAPYTQDSVTYNEGIKTYNRDDKGNYVYGEKELWYLHSVESKTMIATFTVEDRLDLPAITEKGVKYADHSAKRLKEINLYSKADFIKDPSKARPVKTVHFEYSYELCKGVNKPLNDSGKLTLKRIWFSYNGNKKGQQNPYVFNYNSNNPAYNIKSYDRWGNYKDPMQNPGSVTGNVIRNDEYPYTLQDSTLAAKNAAAWMLESVYLPSGGSIKVDYESDEYAYVQNKRAMQMFRIIGLGASPGLPVSNISNKLYDKKTENLYVYIRVPNPVTNVQDIYRKYLDGITKLYFRLSVQMPGDQYGSGNEYVPCYAEIDANSGYGRVNDNVIWVKLSGMDIKGSGGGSYSPLAKAAIQFLRLNIPSQAFPGSEVGDNLDLENGVKMIFGMAENIKESILSFDKVARNNGWCVNIDTNRTFVRLYSPGYRKFGGGHRVKRISIYDNWKKMTGNTAKEAVYGQEYTYNTRKVIGQDSVYISGGVAVYEPGIGGDENPFRDPIEYTEKAGILGPVNLGYTEEPLGEALFPSPSVGYSQVRVRTINNKKKKSANGFSETKFFTAYDFPVYTDRTLIDIDTKKRYKPSIANFLRINAQHHMVISQGFKIELNDMHGKVRSQATYAETDSLNPLTYTENFYKVNNLAGEHKRLANTVSVIKPDGSIDTTAVIGKDVELMMDMREQRSVSNGFNLNLNTETFTLPWPVPPLFLLPSLLNLAQREETLFRSAATLKVIQRYGIVDSVVSIDKGSKVSTKDILYDSETGDAVLTRTQNEFNDPVYNFSYPSHWAYDGMGMAYKNIDAVFYHVTIKNGRIIKGMPAADSLFFVSGDELLAIGKQNTGQQLNCDSTPYSSYPAYTKLWAIDSSVFNGGAHAYYFIDRGGKPYNGFDVALKITRSGRRNILGSVGGVTTLTNPLKKNGAGNYELNVTTATKVVAASAVEYKQNWKVEDIKLRTKAMNCTPVWEATGTMRCVKDSSGNNTGYQEAELKDVNANSPSRDSSRWVVVGYNCLACGGTPYWRATGAQRCARDTNGFYTGYLEYEEEDSTDCSVTSHQTRWITSTYNCTTCPKPQEWLGTGVKRCVLDSAGHKTGEQEELQTAAKACGTGDTTRWASLGMNCDSCGKSAWLSTGNVRCQTDVHGFKTGYQEIEQVNYTVCGDSAGLSRWIAGSINCTLCTQLPYWSQTGNVRCVKDSSGNNTGYQEMEEKNLSVCGDSAGMTRWIAYLNCTACAQPKTWVNTGNVRCVKDSSGNNTGYQEAEQRNTSLCSDSIGATRWIASLNCTACAQPKNWTNTGNVRCVKDSSGNNTGYQEIEQKNLSSCSDSAGMTRWTASLNCTACATPHQWKFVDSFRCVTSSSGGPTTRAYFPADNTGYREQLQIDTSLCFYGLTQWVSIGQDLNACPLPCNELTNCNAVDKRCINGVCTLGTKIYTSAYIEGDHVVCVYHYEWYTGSSIIVSGNFSETHPGNSIPCELSPVDEDPSDE